MIQDNRYLGEIFHYGVKGMKWGVLRSPEQLGHVTGGKQGVEKSDERAKIIDDVYHSEKGFSIAAAKLAGFCLSPDKKHSKEFFDVGYKESDSELLLRDIERGFDLSKKGPDRLNDRGDTQFAIPMELGVTQTRLFNTGWQIDKGTSEPKFVTAYTDRRLRGGD